MFERKRNMLNACGDATKLSASCVIVMRSIHLESQNVPHRYFCTSLYIENTEVHFTGRGQFVCKLLSYCDGTIYQFAFV
jgi:hypothetical protein